MFLKLALSWLRYIWEIILLQSVIFTIRILGSELEHSQTHLIPILTCLIAIGMLFQGSRVLAKSHLLSMGVLSGTLFLSISEMPKVFHLLNTVLGSIF